MQFTAIDFETANSKYTSACSVGLAKVSDGRVVDTLSMLIRPRVISFEPFNISIHGITPRDVENEPEFDELWPIIEDYINGDVLVAHNAQFDMGVLRSTFHEYGIQSPGYAYNCSCNIARRSFKGLVNYKLNTVAEYIGVKFRHHDACEDAYASASIVIEAAKRFKAVNIDHLCHKLGLQMGKL